MTTETAHNARASSSGYERHVWTVFLDVEGTDPQLEVFANEHAAHNRAGNLAGTSSGVRQADGSTCYQDGAGSYYTVRRLLVQS
jgi:hypothetical protein